MSMKKIAVVYIAHDGFSSLYTGVGSVARDFLLSFPEVSKQFKKTHPDIHLILYAVTLKQNKTCFGFSEEVRNTTIAMTKKNRNIKFIELLNGSEGRKAYGTIDNWKMASISAATFLYTLRDTYDEIIAICVDTPFCQVANYFLEAYTSKNIKFIWLPQSTVKIHLCGSSAKSNERGKLYEQTRFLWEKKAIGLANNNTFVKIGCVGSFMKKHLMKAYGAKPKSLINIKNSLYLPRLKKNKISQHDIRSLLRNLKIPIDRQLLFSFGRAEPYKGLDLVLKNVDELIRKRNYFILIFASPYTGDDPYIKKLNELARKYPEDIKIICKTDFITPHYIMQWNNTKILAILSRAEPFGLIPIESRFYNNPHLTLLVSDKDGFKEQVKNGIDGFLTALSTKEIQRKLLHICNLNQEEKKIISQRGYDTIIKQYSQSEITLNFLTKYIVR
jgi:glycosyltransferase involved in cell wall biosynthesis